MDSKIGRSECSRARFGVRKGWGVGAVTCILIWGPNMGFQGRFVEKRCVCHGIWMCRGVRVRLIGIFRVLRHDVR